MMQYVRVVAALAGAAGVLGVAAPASAQLDPIACSADKTFYARGDHWAMVPPLASHPIRFVHQADGPVQTPALPLATAVPVLNRAFADWQAAACRDAQTPNIAFVDASAGGAYYPTRDTGDDTSASDSDDWVFNNVIYWVEDATRWSADSATVAQTITLSTQDTAFIVTADLEFNGVNFNWRARNASGVTVGCAVGASDCFDLYSVALHEIGHFIGFDHVQCSNAVMFPNAAPTVEWEGLSEHEAAGVCHVYRPRNAGVADRDTGEQCFSTSQCPAEPEHVCIQPLGLESGSQFGWCAQTCTSTSGCPIGFVCATHSNGTPFCLPGIHLPSGAGDSPATDNCAAGQWECDDAKCIRDTYRCDGWDDCADGSDEQGCAASSGSSCAASEMQCPSGECLSVAWRCDGISDCADGADEAGCRCSAGQWGCRDGSCLAAALVCDGFTHCAGGSDEGSCGCDTSGSLKCGDGSCIANVQVCDGVVDCNNAADEARCGVITGGVDTANQTLGDMCAACSQGSHCGSGICVDAGTNGGVCSQACRDVAGFGCPEGFDCIEAEDGSQLCFPSSAAVCERADSRSGLNELCYVENGLDNSGNAWAAICGPGLVCVRFKERTQGQQGACVRYCNDVDPLRACPTGLTCCNRIDATTGACIAPSAGFEHGGCFEIRQEGDSCVVAEQSVCAHDTQCVNFGRAALSRCYKLCGTAATSAATTTCVSQQQCVSFAVTGSTASLNICCDAEVFDATTYTNCEPQTSCLFDVGVACSHNSDCRQGQCTKFDGVGVCSRYCDAVTGVGCPSQLDDVNGDGAADSAFECRLIGDVGQCWPLAGPVDPPACATKSSSGDSAATDDGGCACSAQAPFAFGDHVLAMLPWAGLWFVSRRRWRRRRRAVEA